MHASPRFSRQGRFAPRTTRSAALLLITIVTIVAVWPVAASAQTAPARAQRARPAIALTGCLKTSDDPQVFLLTAATRADDDSDAPADPPPSPAPSPSPSPAPSSPASPSSPAPSPAPEPEPSAAPGTASKPTPSRTGDGRTYRIVPLNPKVDVKSHVGEQVEVGGRVTAPPTAATAEKTPVTTIAVAYVRKIADRCGEPPSDR